MKFNVILYFFLFSLLSCNSKEKTQNKFENTDSKKQIYSYKFENIDSKSFKLDSITQLQTSCVEYLDKESKLAFINKNDNSLRIFDYKNGQELEKISFTKQGSDGVVLGAFHYHSKDSIFIYSQTGHVVLANDKGEIKDRIKVAGQTELKVLSSTICQMVWKNDKLYLLATKFSHSYSPFVEVSFTNQTIKQNDFFSVSENYKNGVWGAMNFDFFYTNYNPSTKKWIVSFPNDNYLYYTDLETKTEKIDARSSYFDSVPPPYQNMDEANQDTDYNMTFLRSPSYYMVYTNPYTNYVYRIANYGVTEEDAKSNDPVKSTLSKQSIIVLNEKSEKILEQELQAIKSRLAELKGQK